MSYKWILVGVSLHFTVPNYLRNFYFLPFFFLKHLYSTAGTMDSGVVNICIDTMQDKSIICSDYGAIIRIDKVIAAHIANQVICNETSQSIPGNPPLECRAWQKEVYYRYFRSFSYRLRS